MREEANRFQTHLAGELRRYRMLAWGSWAHGGFALLMIAVGLTNPLNGIMPVKIYNIAMTVAYLFILLSGHHDFHAHASVQEEDQTA